MGNSKVSNLKKSLLISTAVLGVSTFAAVNAPKAHADVTSAAQTAPATNVSSNADTQKVAATSSATLDSTTDVTTTSSSSEESTSDTSNGNTLTSSATTDSSSAASTSASANVAATQQPAATAVTASAAADPEIGFQFLGSGSMSASGTAVAGLTEDSNGQYSGTIKLSYNSTSYGVSYTDSQFTLTVPTELQPLFNSANFKSYISGTFSANGQATYNYTANDITISDNGAHVTFENPVALQLLSQNYDVELTFNIGAAVNATGLKIANSDSNYLFQGGLGYVTSVINWDLFDSDASSAALQTNALMPGSTTTTSDKPYVGQPVYDTDKAVTGSATAGSTVTVKDSSGNTLGTFVATASGYYDVQLNRTLVGGEVLNVTETVNGKVSDPTEVVVQKTAITIAKPTINTIYANDTKITGTGAKAGDLITVVDADGNALGQDYVTSNGTYSVTVNRALVAGESIQVREVRGSDSSDPASKGVLPAVTVTAPTNVIASINDRTISGTGTPGYIVTATRTDGTVYGTALVQSDGSFIISVPRDLVPATPGTVIALVTQSNGTLTSATTYAIFN